MLLHSVFFLTKKESTLACHFLQVCIDQYSGWFMYFIHTVIFAYNAFIDLSYALIETIFLNNSLKLIFLLFYRLSSPLVSLTSVICDICKHSSKLFIFFGSQIRSAAEFSQTTEMNWNGYTSYNGVHVGGRLYL